MVGPYNPGKYDLIEELERLTSNRKRPEETADPELILDRYLQIMVIIMELRRYDVRNYDLLEETNEKVKQYVVNNIFDLGAHYRSGPKAEYRMKMLNFIKDNWRKGLKLTKKFDTILGIPQTSWWS